MTKVGKKYFISSKNINYSQKELNKCFKYRFSKNAILL
jgi:hypothetical protein